MQPLSLKKLNDVWERIKKDPDGRRALTRLDRAGFRISHLRPNDPTFVEATWADHISALPFLDSSPSRTRIHRGRDLSKYVPLVKALQDFAAQRSAPFDEMWLLSTESTRFQGPGSLTESAIRVADFIQNFLSWDWYLRERHHRNVAIAELRWHIRDRTGSPHDRELITIIDAAFRAAGFKKGFYLEPNTLDRIEQREKECRVRAACLLSGIPLPEWIPGARGKSRSTRFGRKRRKRVQSDWEGLDYLVSWR